MCLQLPPENVLRGARKLSIVASLPTSGKQAARPFTPTATLPGPATAQGLGLAWVAAAGGGNASFAVRASPLQADVCSASSQRGTVGVGRVCVP